jgi:K+-transporting ATPase KdpF subunit
MSLPLAALSGADVFGLVVSVLVCAYLLYALLRGENL